MFGNTGTERAIVVLISSCLTACGITEATDGLHGADAAAAGATAARSDAALDGGMSSALDGGVSSDSGNSGVSTGGQSGQPSDAGAPSCTGHAECAATLTPLTSSGGWVLESWELVGVWCNPELRLRFGIDETLVADVSVSMADVVSGETQPPATLPGDIRLRERSASTLQTLASAEGVFALNTEVSLATPTVDGTFAISPQAAPGWDVNIDILASVCAFSHCP